MLIASVRKDKSDTDVVCLQAFYSTRWVEANWKLKSRLD